MDDAHPASIELHERVSGQLVEAVQLVVLRDAAQGVQVAGPAENRGGLEEALGIDFETFDTLGDRIGHARRRSVVRGNPKRLQLLQV